MKIRIAALLLLSQFCLGREINVHQGQSIQVAVDQARSGDRVVVDPGTYHEVGRPCPSDTSAMCAVVISTDGISLVAKSSPHRPVILENAGGQDAGIEAAKAGRADCFENAAAHIEGISITGFTINGFGGSGIRLVCADRWEVAFNSTNNNAEYGIFPVLSSKGRAHHNLATGANDTGIYVGQSHDVRADHNLATNNVSGFEIENSSNVRMDHNEAFGNTGGMLVFILPGLSVLTGAHNTIDHNFIHDNNRANTCLHPEEDVCLVPPGSGILAVAGSKNRIEHNLVLDNISFGIAVSDFCTPFQVPTAQCFSLGFDPLPENTHVVFNVVEGNGTNSQFPGVPGADLFWTGAGTGNCWSHNKADTEIPSPLPACKQ
jgi:parallel beta-helix repeat protein